MKRRLSEFSRQVSEKLTPAKAAWAAKSIKSAFEAGMSVESTVAEINDAPGAPWSAPYFGRLAKSKE